MLDRCVQNGNVRCFGTNTDFYHRRLSAGLGLPMGADERQLRTDLPKPAVGFQPPLPLIVNIQIARATGEITTSMQFSTSFRYESKALTLGTSILRKSKHNSVRTCEEDTEYPSRALRDRPLDPELPND